MCVREKEICVRREDKVSVCVFEKGKESERESGFFDLNSFCPYSVPIKSFGVKLVRVSRM